MDLGSFGLRLFCAAHARIVVDQLYEHLVAGPRNLPDVTVCAFGRYISEPGKDLPECPEDVTDITVIFGCRFGLCLAHAAGLLPADDLDGNFVVRITL